MHARLLRLRDIQRLESLRTGPAVSYDENSEGHTSLTSPVVVWICNYQLLVTMLEPVVCTK